MSYVVLAGKKRGIKSACNIYAAKPQAMRSREER
jgi:hypothetical protein